jgi:hypothetical protein
MELSGQLHDPAALLPGKEPPVPIGLDAVVKRETPSPYRDSNPRSSSPYPMVIVRGTFDVVFDF